MAMGIVSVVLGFFPQEIMTETHITNLGISLTALAIAPLIPDEIKIIILPPWADQMKSRLSHNPEKHRN